MFDLLFQYVSVFPFIYSHKLFFCLNKLSRFSVSLKRDALHFFTSVMKFSPAKREIPGLPNNGLPIENSQLQKSLDFCFGAITLLIISSKLGSDNLACSDQKIEDLICLS